MAVVSLTPVAAVAARPGGAAAGARPVHSGARVAPAARAARVRPAARLAARAAAADGAAAAPVPPPPPPPPPPVVRTDFLVLGSGIAGLTFALRAARHGTVAVATKAAASAGCTSYAQGGVCAALAPGDSPAAHAADTLRAGDWANDAAAVAAVCGEGPDAVLELAALGARFTREAGARGVPAAAAAAAAAFHLTREGGHSARRVVHAADATGAEVQRALEAAVAACPAITVYEHVVGLDLVLAGDDDDDGASGRPGAAASFPGGRRPCVGADALHTPTGSPVRFVAGATILATGGAGAAFPLTTNPAVATGDGLAMAARAGARLADMEFVQFHPTAFCPPVPGGASSSPAAAAAAARASPLLPPPPPSQQVFLISEAVRGEGGRLYNDAGDRFMARADPARLELAPRDVVARAIEAERARTGARCVWLDVSHLPADRVLAHFPTIAARCAAAGVDITAAPIPVAPAQHYMCGGVRAGLHAQTDVPGLFAVGEAARTGLHGANRLASNSLLEGLVFARRAADGGAPDAAPAAAVRAARYAGRALAAAAEAGPAFAPGAAATTATAVAQWAAGRRGEAAAALGAAAGIVRTRAGLASGAASLGALAADVDAVYEAASGGARGGRRRRRVAARGGAAPPRPPAPPLALVELRNVLAVGRAVVAAGLSRRESRGGHYLADAPPPRAPPARARAGPAVSTCLSLDAVAAVCASAASGASGAAPATRAPSPPRPPPTASDKAGPAAAKKKASKKGKAAGGPANNVVSGPPLAPAGDGAPGSGSKTAGGGGVGPAAREVATRAEPE